MPYLAVRITPACLELVNPGRKAIKDYLSLGTQFVPRFIGTQPVPVFVCALRIVENGHFKGDNVSVGNLHASFAGVTQTVSITA